MRAGRHFSVNWMRLEFSGLWLSEGSPTHALYLMNLFAGQPDNVHYFYHKYDSQRHLSKLVSSIYVPTFEIHPHRSPNAEIQFTHQHKDNKT